jgi:tetratricopeptide (TPR) repeat protein
MPAPRIAPASSELFRGLDSPIAPAEATASLRAQGRARLKANAFAEAIEFLARAVTAEPRDAPTQLDLGIALQGAGHHAEALEFFTSAQKLLPSDSGPFLHAAISLLNLNRSAEAVHAASEACHRAPQLAQAHYTYGQTPSAHLPGRFGSRRPGPRLG